MNTTSVEFLFRESLNEEQMGQVEDYVRSRLDHARARCIWHSEEHLELECTRALTRSPGIIRLHFQTLTKVSTELLDNFPPPRIDSLDEILP